MKRPKCSNYPLGFEGIRASVCRGGGGGDEHKDNQQHVRFVRDEATFGPPHLAVGVK